MIRYKNWNTLYVELTHIQNKPQSFITNINEIVLLLVCNNPRVYDCLEKNYWLWESSNKYTIF